MSEKQSGSSTLPVDRGVAPFNSPDGATDSALASIVRSSSDAVIAKTVAGIVTAWNDGATRTYGHTADQMLGQSIEITIPEEWLTQERERHARVASGLSESGYRCVRLRADGNPIDVVMSMSPVRDRGGRVIGVASISRPLSDQESADARFASLLEVAPDAMVCVNASGLITLINAQVTAVFGYSREELIGASLEVLVPDEIRYRHPQHRAAFLHDPKPRPMGTGLALRGRHADGSTFPVEVSLAADVHNGDAIVIAAIRDVTEQRATEAALRDNETRLRQLADNVDIVFTMRQIRPPKFLYVSPAFHKLTGYEPAEIEADPELSLKLVHPDDRERVERSYFAPIRAARACTSEHRIIRADGEVRWIRASVNPVPNPHGPPERLVTITEDITDRVRVSEALREAEAAARAANEAKNLFLSRMSHELRTPLNAVLGFGQVLERRLRDTEHVEPVRHVLQAGRHLLNLINEILDIARIESGELTVSAEPVSVVDIVDESARLMQPLAVAAGVSLLVVGGAPASYVLADRQRLRQVLLNLISNAIKYNRPQGSVRVSWSTEDRRLSIAVEDDGPGIPVEVRGRLFMPFDRLGAESTGVEGTGIGLTVSRSLAELMNGALNFESDDGCGATFTVTLPESDAPSAAIAAEPNSALPTRDTEAVSATVLYIEDNEPNVRVMESVLGLRPEWQMMHAALANLGLELAHAHRPDLILLDLHLPDRSGLDVLIALRRDPVTAQIPVVVLTADASATQAQRLAQAGASRYLTKPLVLDEILATLDSITGADIGIEVAHASAP
ncbi:MAG: PAS domain S-box protein [Candidatus Dormiibacterota bacterium]